MNSIIAFCLLCLETCTGTYGFLLQPNSTEPKEICKDLDAHGCAVNPDLCEIPVLARLTCPRTCNVCVDGVWANWGHWSQCDVSCSTGTSTRTRSCTNPPPAHCGDNCQGPSQETSKCMLAHCPAADCSDLLHLNQRTTGVYEVTTWNTSTKVRVYCDMETDGGGWTVFQRRFDGAVEFYRNFVAYENGFGNLSGEFWLGLRLIHELTARKGRNNVVRLDAEAADGTMAFDAFNAFTVDAAPGYTAHIGTRNSSLNIQFPPYGYDHINNHNFSTYDRDQDQWSGNCAQSEHGAWWYQRCHYANPNGMYLPPGTISDLRSMHYTAVYGPSINSLRTIKLMFR